jgi:hypothetical protein
MTTIEQTLNSIEVIAPIDVDAVRLYWPRTFIADVLPLSGLTEGGLVSDPNAGTRIIKVTDGLNEYEVEIPHEYYPVLARVLKTHPDSALLPGEVVRFRPLMWDHVEFGPQQFYIIHEDAALAVIDGFNEEAARLSQMLTEKPCP